MNILSFEQQCAVIGALTEGASIRSVERLTGIHRDTIMRLAARVGLGATKFHDRTVHSVQVSRIELDECWSFVAKKARNWKPADGPNKGDYALLDYWPLVFACFVFLFLAWGVLQASAEPNLETTRRPLFIEVAYRAIFDRPRDAGISRP